MNNILSKLLQKRGINSVNDMTQDEQQTFEQWNRVLSGDDITVDSIIQFCKSQISVIESKWRDLSVSSQSKSELIPYHTAYKMIVMAIEAPKAEREALERQLNDLIKRKV